VSQGHVPKAESLYLLRCADCIQKRLWVTVPEGVFYLGGSFLGRRLPHDIADLIKQFAGLFLILPW